MSIHSQQQYKVLDNFSIYLSYPCDASRGSKDIQIILI